MLTRPPRPLRPGLAAAISLGLAALVVALLAVACGVIPPAALIEGRDYRLDPRTRMIYGRTPELVDTICRMRGADVGRLVAMWGEQPFLIEGCYDPADDVIVGREGTQPGEAIWEHEMAHRRGWRHE